MIQTILFATDLCVFTPYLLRHVSDLAQRWGAKAVLVHVVEPLGSLGTAVVNAYLPKEDCKSFNEQGLEHLLASIKDRLIELLADEILSGEEGAQVIEDVIVEMGKPQDVILQMAEVYGADLIVLGSHFPEKNGEQELGSVAAKVMQASRVPVYLVPVLPNSPALHNSPESWVGLG